MNKDTLQFKTDNYKLKLNEDSAKYLYDIGNTIGFRKDKKLYKFVGIRDGYNKQLELSIKSIIIDGVEKITDNNYTSMLLDDKVGIIHNINNNKFLNILSENNYKNLLKVENLFTNIEILYEIHINKLKIKNVLTDNQYKFDYLRRFILTDGDDNILFSINRPATYDSDGNRYNNVSHELYYNDDKLMYKKTIKNNNIKDKYPLFIDISINFNILLPSLLGNTVNKIYGQTFKHSEPNEKFQLTAYTNVIGGTITWVDNIIDVNYIGTGKTITISSSNYKTGDVIYANVIGVEQIISPTETTKILSLSKNAYVDQGEPSNHPIGNPNYISIGEGGWIVYDRPRYGNCEAWLSFDLSSIPNGSIINSVKFYFTVNQSNCTNSTGTGYISTHYLYKSNPNTNWNQDTITWNTAPNGSLNSTPSATWTWETIDSNWATGQNFEIILPQSDIESSLYSGEITYKFINGADYWEIIPNSVSLKILYQESTMVDGDNYYALCNEPLAVTLDISNTYSSIPQKYNNIKPVDIDAVYFKYHKCMSGACYMYIRDITNIFEQNELVSDKAFTGSYNMYSEYDIIDEFYSNSHQVEVACDYNVDLTKNYKQLDNVFVHQETRVLLFNQTDMTQNGIYKIDNNFKLVKQDELGTIDKMFRYKVHVNAGTYFEKEFHLNEYYII